MRLYSRIGYAHSITGKWPGEALRVHGEGLCRAEELGDLDTLLPTASESLRGLRVGGEV